MPKAARLLGVLALSWNIKTRFGINAQQCLSHPHLTAKADTSDSCQSSELDDGQNQ